MEMPKKSEAGRKKYFKFSWPKLKIIVIEKRDILLDPKAAALKASRNMMLEATNVHQLKLVDHQVKKAQKEGGSRNILYSPFTFAFYQPSPSVLPEVNEESNNQQGNECHNRNPPTPIKAIKCSIFTDKVSKDSLIGVSIMLVTLIIMLMWGRLCAILCMSAWLYCIPLFRPANRSVIISNLDGNKVRS